MILAPRLSLTANANAGAGCFDYEIAAGAQPVAGAKILGQCVGSRTHLLWHGRRPTTNAVPAPKLYGR